MALATVVGMAVAAGAVVHVLFQVARWFRMWRLAERFPGPPGLPLLGNILDFSTNDPVQLAAEALTVIDKYGPNLRLWFGPMLGIIVTDPQDIEIVLVRYKLMERAFLYKPLRQLLGSGVVTCPAARWAAKRKTSANAMNGKYLEQYQPRIQAAVNALVAKLAKLAESADGTGTGTALDVHGPVGMCTMDAICETAMGQSLCAQASSEDGLRFMHSLDTVQDVVQTRVLRPWLMLDAVFRCSAEGARSRQAYDFLSAYTQRIITNQRRRRGSSGSRSGSRMSFLEQLLEDHSRTPQEIQDEVLTLVVGAHETSAATASAALVLLALHPHVQDRLLEEVVHVLGEDPDSPVEMHHLPQLQYVECVFKEALRMFSPFPYALRTTNEDVKLSRQTIPAGANIYIVWPHRSAKHFREPDAFIPERHLGEEAAGRHPYAFRPFSGGARQCLGQKYAYNLGKTLLASVVRRFRLLPGQPGHDLKPSLKLLTKIHGGYPVRLLER